MKRSMLIAGLVVGLILSFLIVVPAKAADTVDQLLTKVDDILSANPMKAGDKVQIITVAQDDTLTFNIARLNEGGEIKPHFHKTHSESVYVIQGNGQMLINGKWLDVMPGSVHFNPMNKVHATKNTGKDPLVIFSVFTPVMRETDRYFVK